MTADQIGLTIASGVATALAFGFLDMAGSGHGREKAFDTIMLVVSSFVAGIAFGAAVAG